MQTINLKQVASLSALENDFCKLLKPLKNKTKTNTDSTSLPIVVSSTVFRILIRELSVFEKQKIKKDDCSDRPENLGPCAPQIIKNKAGLHGMLVY